MLYKVFVRSWWKDNPDWPDGLEPHAGEKVFLRAVLSEREARAICARYNSTHQPGRYSYKAEYERVESRGDMAPVSVAKQKFTHMRCNACGDEDEYVNKHLIEVAVSANGHQATSMTLCFWCAELVAQGLRSYIDDNKQKPTMY